MDPNGSGIAGFWFGFPTTPAEAEGIIFPIPWEGSATYRHGTARAPEAIREASRFVEYYSPAFPEIEFWKVKIAGVPACADIVQWNEAVAPEIQRFFQNPRHLSPEQKAHLQRKLDTLTEKMCSTASLLLQTWHQQGKWTIVVGGDHTCLFPHWQAVLTTTSAVPLLFVLDAHVDLRPEYEGFRWTHASVIARLLEFTQKTTGRFPSVIFLGTRALAPIEQSFLRKHTQFLHVFPARRCLDPSFPDAFAQFLREIHRAHPNASAYISVDVDVLDTPYVPGTGTPVPGGLTYLRFQDILRLIASEFRIVGADLCESGSSPVDADISAHMLLDLCSALVYSRRKQ